MSEDDPMAKWNEIADTLKASVAALQSSPAGYDLADCVEGLKIIRRFEHKLWENIARHPETSTDLLMEMSKLLAPDEKLLTICVRNLGKRAPKDMVAQAFLEGMSAHKAI